MLPFEHCQDCGGQSGDPCACCVCTGKARALRVDREVAEAKRLRAILEEVGQ